MLNASLPAAILFGRLYDVFARDCLCKIACTAVVEYIDLRCRRQSPYIYRCTAQCALQMEIKRYDNNNHGPCQSRQPQPLSHQRRCWINNFKHSIQFACGSVDGTKSDIDAATQTAHTHNITIKWIYMHFMHIFFFSCIFRTLSSHIPFHCKTDTAPHSTAQHRPRRCQA